MKKLILALLLIITSLLVGCTQTESTPTVPDTQEPSIDWMNIPLADIRTGETYSISDFDGKPVLIESFAVWCPLCTKQQRNIKALHEEIGDAIVSISLDTDPNEDVAIVLDHLTRNNFEWRYSISPVKLTSALIAEFGSSIANAPSAPVVLVCPDGNSRLLPRGVKSVDELKKQIEQGC